MSTGRLLLIFFIAIAALALEARSQQVYPRDENLPHAVFGNTHISHPSHRIKGLVLLISGNDGWNADVAEIGGALLGLDYLVAGIDLNDYLRSLDDAEQTCGNPGKDLVDLGRFLSERYQLSGKTTPILVGYGAGAALAYVAVAQAPIDSFHAAVSLEFCPQVSVRRTFCQTRALESKPSFQGQGAVLIPSSRLQAPWFLFQSNPACSEDSVAQFVKQSDNAKLVYVPGGSHTGPGQKKWLPQFSALLQWLDPNLANQIQVDVDVSGVPLTEIPAAGPPKQHLAVMLSGDGGWAALDRTVAAELANHGVGTVGWDSLSYFWRAKSPDEAAADLGRVLRHYLTVWNKTRVLLIGYSFGADALPFMANRLDSDLRQRIDLIALLGLSDTASFEFHLSDWLGQGPGKNNLAVRPEVKRLGWTRCLCIYGDVEKDSACPGLVSMGVTVVKMPGDHHFNGDYPKLVQHILDRVTP